MAVQGTDVGHCATHTYRTMKDIMEELGPIIYGTVTSDSDEDTAGGNNRLRSALCQWTNVNRLPNVATETDEHALAYRKWQEHKLWIM